MTMKYRHRGYRDTEREEQRDRSRPPAAPRTQADRAPISVGERAQQRSLRHAVGRDAQQVIRCPSCGRNAPGAATVAIEAACPHCGASLHSCRSCRSFDPAVRWECRRADEVPARVTDKGAANGCPLHEPRLVLDSTGKRSAPPARGGANDPKSQFESLFKR